MALYINGNKTGGGGSNADIVHLTQAEYDALPDSKLSDNKVYMITDVNGDESQFQPIIYSEEEREVGVWTDGKPLYQKTILFMTNNSSGWTDVPHEINNIDEIINIQGIIDGYTSGTNAQGGVAFFGNDTNVSAFTNTSSLYNKLAKLTIQYTKTTDTAGSGTWTPQGVPAVHYSTDEKVVGTWVDGSTVYEKTFSFTPTDNNFYIDVTSLNIDKIINSNGSIFQSYGNVVPLPYGTNSSDFAIAYYDSNNEKLKISEASGQDNYNLNVQWIVTWQYTKSSQGGN